MSKRTVSLPRPGWIGLTFIEGGVGRLIRLGQFLNGDGYADYEHAFGMTTFQRAVEAMPGGAREVAWDHYDPSRVIWLRCPDELSEAVALQMKKMLGVPYSFADYGALAATRLHLPLSRRLLGKYVENSGHLICSQLVDLAAERGGWHLFDDGRKPRDVTPGDLFRLYGQQEKGAAPWQLTG